MTPAAPPRLDEQVGHRSDVVGQRLLLRRKRGFVGRPGRGEAHDVVLFGLLDRDQHAVRGDGGSVIAASHSCAIQASSSPSSTRFGSSLR